MRTRKVLVVLAVATAGVVVGASVTLAVQGRPSPKTLHSPPGPASVDVTAKAAGQLPRTVLAWTPGRMPNGFQRKASRLKEVAHAVVVDSGLGWLTGSRSASGAVVDSAPKGLAYPLEVAAVDPGAYRPFLPPADYGVIDSLSAGQVVLGKSSAKFRGLGPGSVLGFGKIKLEVAAVLPDELMGAHEVLASKDTAARLGVSRPRYALIDPVSPSSPAVTGRALTKLATHGEPMRIRLPGETPYFRMGDAVLPQIALKQVFGEFAAKPRATGLPMVIDSGWQHRFLETKRVPILGTVTCNRAIFPQLEGALRQIQRDGLAHFIDPRDYGGCYSPRFLDDRASLGISHHAWGAALDINVSQNPFGHSSQMNPRIVQDFADWGFTWGGNWLVPDGMHFEYIGPPRSPG